MREQIILVGVLISTGLSINTGQTAEIRNKTIILESGGRYYVSASGHIFATNKSEKTIGAEFQIGQTISYTTHRVTRYTGGQIKPNNCTFTSLATLSDGQLTMTVKSVACNGGPMIRLEEAPEKIEFGGGGCTFRSPGASIPCRIVEGRQL